MALDAHHHNEEIQCKLERIYNLHSKKMDFRLDGGPYIDLLNNLGNPHLHLPPVIHLAGTNGKGSTLAFIKSIYEAAGLKVHAYISPHLIKFNERITLAGSQIEDNILLDYLDVIEKTNNGAPITFFEYTTALAFKAFADHPADICLLETGMGGRLDCTNVVPSPFATIITSIGYDHMDWLGHDITAIAQEKACIMKADTPCFIAPQNYDINDVFKTKGAEIGCDVHFVNRIDDIQPLRLVGDHQKDNASTAVTALSVIAPQFDKTTMHNGLKNTQWPARMEKISNNPEIWFDCGHNADGALAIAAQLKQWTSDFPNKSIYLVLGLAADKDPNQFLSPLWGYIENVTCVDLMNARNPQSGEDLKNKITAKKPVMSAADAKQAIEMIDNSNVIILMTGSLYLYEQLKD